MVTRPSLFSGTEAEHNSSDVLGKQFPIENAVEVRQKGNSEAVTRHEDEEPAFPRAGSSVEHVGVAVPCLKFHGPS